MVLSILDYITVRRRRSRLSIVVDGNRGVRVMAPLGVNEKVIEAFVASHKEWIEKALSKVEKKKEIPIPGAQKSFHAHNARAKKILTQRVQFFAKQMGVKVSKVTIKRTKRQWGSCSSSGVISLHYKLIFLSPQIMDYVVVHELCHITHPNHSSAFWRAVEAVFPTYRQAKAELSEYSP